MKQTAATEWLTVNEAAEYLGITPATVRTQLSNGRLPYSIIERRNKIAREDLDEYARTRRNVGDRKAAARRFIAECANQCPDWLDYRDWEIIRTYADTDASVRDLADQFALTHARIHQIIAQTVRA